MSGKNKVVVIFTVLLLIILSFSYVYIFKNKSNDNPDLPKKEKQADTINDDSKKYYLYNPNNENPGQLEFKLSGTAQYRGLILTDIEMSTQYKGVIKSGIIRNTGNSDLYISRLYANGQNKNESKQIYRGHFEITGIIINSDGIFEPKLLLKRGENKNVYFAFDEENGNAAYYGYDTPADQVFLNGLATEIKEPNK